MTLKMLTGHNAFACHRCKADVPWSREETVAGDTETGFFYCPSCSEIVWAEAKRAKPKPAPAASMAAMAGTELASHDPEPNGHGPYLPVQLSAKLGLPNFSSISAGVSVQRREGEAEEEFRARARREFKIAMNEVAVAFAEIRDPVMRAALK